MTDAVTETAPATPASTPPVVTVSAGSVRGSREGAIDRFLGIPYAAPPVGDLRFAPPAPRPRGTASGMPRPSVRRRRSARTHRRSRHISPPSRCRATTS